MIQALMAMTEKEGAIEDEWGIAGLWARAALPVEIDINLRLYIRGLQAVALDGRRDIGPLLTELDALVQEAGDNAWGTAIASSLLAIRFWRKHPTLANRYILTALRSIQVATLPDGRTAIPMATVPWEGLFWATALSASSDSDVESWIASVRQLNKDQIARLAASELAKDNSTILCDGVWLREYQEDEKERNWDSVEQLVERIEGLGREIGLPVLEAAAIRTRIMIMAEWRHNVTGALQLADLALQKFDDEENRFLITEVMGRQLSYAHFSSEAIEWLQRARSFQVVGHTLWCRNALITLAREIGRSDTSLASKYVEEAVELSQTIPNKERTIETLAEHGVALWNDGRRDAAFAEIEIAVQELLATEHGDLSWKKLFLALFQTVFYFSSIAYHGHPPTDSGSWAPTQGMFLGLDSMDITKFTPAQKSFIRIRMAMFAEALGKLEATGFWSDEALRLAAEIPDARTIYSFAWLSIAPALLRNDYPGAVRAALLMATAGVPEDAQLARIGVTETDRQRLVQDLVRSPARAATAMLFLAVPLAYRLMTLKWQGENVANINVAVEKVCAQLSGSGQHRLIVDALRAVLIETPDWTDFKKRADDLVPRLEDTAAGTVYMVGAASYSPPAQAIVLHAWLLRNGAKLFTLSRSIRHELFYPFFRTFWTRAVLMQPYHFRTGETYTRQCVESADGSTAAGVKHLLQSMSFCLGSTLPENALEIE